MLNDTSAGSCAPRAAMRAVRLDVALSSGSLGWPVSRLMPANDTGSNSSWVQDFAITGGLGGSVGNTGAVVASVEGLPLGAFVFQPSRCGLSLRRNRTVQTCGVGWVIGAHMSGQRRPIVQPFAVKRMKQYHYQPVE